MRCPKAAHLSGQLPTISESQSQSVFFSVVGRFVFVAAAAVAAYAAVPHLVPFRSVPLRRRVRVRVCFRVTVCVRAVNTHTYTHTVHSERERTRRHRQPHTDRHAQEHTKTHAYFMLYIDVRPSHETCTLCSFACVAVQLLWLSHHIITIITIITVAFVVSGFSCVCVLIRVFVRLQASGMPHACNRLNDRTTDRPSRQKAPSVCVCVFVCCVHTGFTK